MTTIPFSLLDLAPVCEGSTPAQAFANTAIRARERLVDGFTVDDFGTWRGTQYAVPLHHQGCLLVTQSDILQEAGIEPRNAMEIGSNETI